MGTAHKAGTATQAPAPAVVAATTDAAPEPGDGTPPDEPAEPQPSRRTYVSNIEIRGMHDDGKPWPAPGQPVELAEDVAGRYLAAGYVVEVPGEPGDDTNGAAPAAPPGAAYRSVRAGE